MTLTWEPSQVFQAGFQLSFLVVLCILLLLPPLRRWAERLTAPDPMLPEALLPRWRRLGRGPARYVGGLLPTSFAAWAGSLPLAAYYFHIVTPVSTQASVVAAPLCGVVLMSNLACLLVAGWFPAAAECFNHAGWFLMVGLNGLTFPSVCPEWRQSMSTTMSFVLQKPRNTKFFPTAALGLLLATGLWAAETPQPETGFVSLFDGNTLDGWKVGQNAGVFQVRDGMIVMECPATTRSPAHLFYVGSVNSHSFKNFDLRVDVLTFPCANSGIYFHTDYQESGWPRLGLECQVDNSHVDWRRTGSLYGIRNISWGPEAPPASNKEPTTILPKPPVKDNVWYTQEVLYQNGSVTVKLDGQTMFEYKIANADVQHKLSTGVTWLPRGTFALQGHPPMPGHISKACFRNIRVKVLPD